jgi:hypothetical protein
VAELADAPDLGFQNHCLQNVSSRFKKQSIYEGKTHFFTPEVAFTNDEQKSARSSTKLVHRSARLYFLRVRLLPNSAPATRDCCPIAAGFLSPWLVSWSSISFLTSDIGGAGSYALATENPSLLFWG